MTRSLRSIEPPARGAPFAVDALTVLAAGALHAHALSTWLDSAGAAWLQMLAVALLAWRVGAARSVWRGAALGALFGVAWLVGSVWWLFISMHRYGGLPTWMAALAVLALCAFLALYLALAMGVWVRMRLRLGQRQRFHSAFDALAFAALWLLAELARGLVFTGFPWAAAGYAHADGTLAPLAPWLGVYGLGAMAALVAALLAAAFASARSMRERLGCAALALGLWWAPVLAARLAPAAFDFTAAAGTLSVALVQTNIAQDEKFASERQPEAIEWMLRAMVRSQAELVVAPETAIPLLPEQLPPGFWDDFVARITEGSRAALVGLPLGDFAQGYTNSAAGLSVETRALPGGFYRYDKHHLVPFGEFIPLGFRWFLDMMNMPLGDFARGPLVAPSFAVRGQRVAPNICYEDLFGEELAARFVDAAQAPTVLANLSNIAWFGKSLAIDQHLQISRMRSLELQRPMIRATNTGATVVIDHRGVVTHMIEPHTRGVLEATVEGRTGTTPYAWWAGRFGLWPLMVAAALVVTAAARRARR